MNPKELLDNLVRDLTTAHPMPKSAVRRRILDLLEAVAVACEGEKLQEMGKITVTFGDNTKHSMLANSDRALSHNAALDTAANLIRSLKGDEK